MKKPLPMRFVAIVPRGNDNIAIGPFTSFKAAEGIAAIENGYVLPMLRVDRFGTIEERTDI